MKRDYISPILHIVVLDGEDVVWTSSGTTEGNDFTGDEGWGASGSRQRTNPIFGGA